MKKLLIISAALLALIGTPALSADMALKAPPPAPAPVYSWTGFYIGADIGGAWENNSSVNWLPLPSPGAFGANPTFGTMRGSSVIGGGHIGFDYQFSPVFVGGVEGDWEGTRAKSTVTMPWTVVGTAIPVAPGAATTMSSTLNWLASARAKAGVLVNPNLLAYVTGGAAWGEVNYAGATACPLGPGSLCGPPGYTSATNFSHTSDGWVGGGGLEWAFTANWLARVQYLYYHLNSGQAVTVNSAAFPANPSTFTWSRNNINVVTAGISYKFGGPVAAK
jgi:outer membrane immunogenic protein